MAFVDYIPEQLRPEARPVGNRLRDALMRLGLIEIPRPQPLAIEYGAWFLLEGVTQDAYDWGRGDMVRFVGCADNDNARPMTISVNVAVGASR